MQCLGSASLKDDCLRAPPRAAGHFTGSSHATRAGWQHAAEICTMPVAPECDGLRWRDGVVRVHAVEEGKGGGIHAQVAM